MNRPTQTFRQIIGRLLIGVYLIAATFRGYRVPTEPHGQRQVDTIGMTLAAFHDLHGQSIFTGLKWLFYPRVLQRGLSSGINASEFPLLNWLCAPFVVWGPHAGAIAMIALITAINLIAAYFFLPRFFKLWKVSLTRFESLLLYFCIPLTQLVSNITIPEGLSLPLLMIGLTLFLEEISPDLGSLPTPLHKNRQSHEHKIGLRTKRRMGAIIGTFIGTCICLSLSIAIKPMAVTGLFLVPLYLWENQKRSQVWIFASFLCGVALLFPAWWYTAHAKELFALSDGAQVFALAKFEPLRRLQEIGIRSLFLTIFNEITFRFFPPWVGLPITAFIAWKRPTLALAMLMALLSVFALDGSHAEIHFYYFYGVIPYALLALGLCQKELVKTAKTKPYLEPFIWGFVFFGILWGIRTDIWRGSRTPDTWANFEPIRHALANVNSRGPEATVITDDEVDAGTLIFLNHPGTIAGKSIGGICQSAPYQKRTLHLVIENGHYPLPLKNYGPCLEQAVLVATTINKSHQLLRWESGIH